MPRCYRDNHGLASPRGFWGEQGYGALGRREPKKKTSLRGKRAYVVHLALPSFPQQVRWADLRDAVSFTPFAAIVLTAGPKSQKARLRIHRIHELRLGGTLHGEIWPAHEVFGGSRDTGLWGDGSQRKKRASGANERTSYTWLFPHSLSRCGGPTCGMPSPSLPSLPSF